MFALDDPPLTGKPVVRITVANPSEPRRAITLDATVDTGFTGFLTLRPDVIAQFSLPHIINRPAVLADGAIGHYDVHVGRIGWHGQQRLVPVYEMDSDPLVGMALLWNSRLTMDVVPDGAVTIVPMLS
ncbi:MAG: clan AA aspartic protease [Chloroflexota bacterium]|nr:clan AA aspartic protease [Chloroflexota bacterium]MDE2958866.1 clan AA aspartic protease [Chloroflexota bacterium]